MACLHRCLVFKLSTSSANLQSRRCSCKTNEHEFRGTLAGSIIASADYCEEGIGGEYVYHRTFEKIRPVAVVSLREDAPYGFRVYEIKGKKTEYIDDELELKIIKHFVIHGVYKMASMEGLLRELGYKGGY